MRETAEGGKLNSTVPEQIDGNSHLEKSRWAGVSGKEKEWGKCKMRMSVSSFLFNFQVL